MRAVLGVLVLAVLGAACSSSTAPSTTAGTTEPPPASTVSVEPSSTTAAPSSTTAAPPATEGGTGTTLAGAAAPTTMLVGRNGWSIEELFTVGDVVGGYRPPGVLDGIGAFELDEATVRLLVNHEFGERAGYPYQLGNGTQLTGARISFFDVDKATRGMVGAGVAYDAAYDRRGDPVTRPEQVNEKGDSAAGFSRFCSGQYVAGGGAFGFLDDVFFTGEEVGTADHPHGGSVWALDPARGALWALPELGRGMWENVTPLATGDPGTIALLLGDDTGPAPLYLWVGRLHPDATADAFPRRNGLEEGTLYVWAADVVGVRTPADFAGTGASLAGTFVPIEVRDEAAAGSPGHDAAGYKDEDTLKAEALETLRAFAFLRPEDLATDPADATVAVLAATGAALDIDGWGAVYLVDVDFSSTDAPTARISILHDGNDLRDDGIRNPDNLDWADNGSIYVQEDKAIVVFGLGSGRDSSIYELDPSTGAFGVIAEIDRSVVRPAGANDPAKDGIGAWESSGILDVSSLFDIPAGETLLVANVQAHSITGGPIAEQQLVQGGQLLWIRRPG